MDRKILVASTNPGKVAELSAMLAGEVEPVGLSDFAGVEEIAEDGRTFAANARKKAVGYARATGLWTIADDSGLVVDALGGRPGVESARFSQRRRQGADRRDVDRSNMAKVLKLLEPVEQGRRTARFVCCLSLASVGGVLLEAEGVLEGLITTEPMGENGFGYDPIFFVPELGRTVAQLTAEQKNAISHRGRAIAKLRERLEGLLRRR